MNLLLDTNILIAIARSRNVNGLMQFINSEDFQIYISIVSEAEIRSFAIKNKWGYKPAYGTWKFFRSIANR